jgi:hypothetical protein
VKLIDRNKKSTERLAETLKSTLVLTGDATDEDLLLEENIEDMDVFCALTNDDEDNIMSSLLAKRLGAKKVIALINRSTYVDLLQGGEIDIACRRPRRPSVRCSPISGAATWPWCIACAAVLPRPWRRWCMATPNRRS